MANDRIIQSYLERIEAILSVLPNTSLQPVQLNSHSLLARLTQATSPPPDPVATESVAAEIQTKQPTPADSIPIDENLDLSIDPEGTVWEEWVEDEDFRPDSILSSPFPGSTMLDRPEHILKGNINQIGVKPALPRHPAESNQPVPPWDKFAPDWIELDR